MNIPIVYGAAPGLAHHLDTAGHRMKKILEELSVQTPEIDLFNLNFPFYNGIITEQAAETLGILKEAKGIIFICQASFYTPCAIMQSFLEYFTNINYPDGLKDKCCLAVVCSDVGTEGEALANLEKTIHYLGGFTSPGLALTKEHVKGLNGESEIDELLEKYVEDFYRNLRSIRKFLIPSDHKKYNTGKDSTSKASYKPEAVSQFKRQPKFTVEELDKRVQDKVVHQEQAINEITQFFAEKYKAKSDEGEEAVVINPVFNEILSQTEAPTAPRLKTCKQITQNLPHYFQPHLAADLDLVMQINIGGGEPFEAYLTIQNSECIYADGQAPYPDITIIAPSNVWEDILKGKYTAQKAFMIGQLKVRGNFVFLSKFDQIFKIA